MLIIVIVFENYCYNNLEFNKILSNLMVYFFWIEFEFGYKNFLMWISYKKICGGGGGMCFIIRFFGVELL